MSLSKQKSLLPQSSGKRLIPFLSQLIFAKTIFPLVFNIYALRQVSWLALPPYLTFPENFFQWFLRFVHAYSGGSASVFPFFPILPKQKGTLNVIYSTKAKYSILENKNQELGKKPTFGDATFHLILHSF